MAKKQPDTIVAGAEFDMHKALQADNYFAQLMDWLQARIGHIDAAVFFQLNEQNHMLYIKQAWGFERDICGIYPRQASEGICGAVFSSNQALLLTEPHEIDYYGYELAYFSELIRFHENLNPPIPSSVIAVPVCLKEKKIGVLQLLSFSRDTLFAAQDLAHCHFAAGLISAKQQLKQLSKENAQTKEDIRSLRQLLERNADELRLSATFDQEIDHLFLRGKGFAEMLALAESRSGLPFALYNTFMERICHTPSASQHKLPPDMISLLQTQNIQQSKSVQILVNGAEQLLLAPIFCNDWFSGFVVAWKLEPFAEEDKLVIQGVCRGVSFVWLKQAAAHDANQYLKSEFLSGILAGTNDQSTENKAEILGLSDANRFLVILFADPKVENHMDYCEQQSGRRLHQYLVGVMNQKLLKHIVIPERHDICLIISYPEKSDREGRYDNIINDMMMEISEHEPALLIGGSRIYNGLHNIRKCYWEANQSLIIIRKYFIHRTWLNFREMGVLRLLLTHKKEDIDAYLYDILGPVIEYDKTRGTQLLTTLFYYSRLNKSVTYVANKLHIHSNTLYQRIKKVEDLLGYNFEHPMDWFDIQAASILHGLIHTDLITTI